MAKERNYERRVAKSFRDKNDGGKVYPRGSKFVGDKKRVDGLSQKGFLEEVETAVPQNDQVETADKKASKTENKKAAKDTKEGE